MKNPAVFQHAADDVQGEPRSNQQEVGQYVESIQDTCLDLDEIFERSGWNLMSVIILWRDKFKRASAAIT